MNILNIFKYASFAERNITDRLPEMLEKYKNQNANARTLG
jgi:hypothetical protein